MKRTSKIIFALDSNNYSKIKKTLKLISKNIYGVKIGYQFFFNFGTKGYNLIKKMKLKIFFDFKFHDIPNTVSNAIGIIKKLNAEMITVHISGGKKMLNEAKKNSKKVKIIGVTALTSLDDKNIYQIYKRKNVEQLVKEMINIAIKSKLDGIVCSPKEIKLVKKISKRKLIIITPGIRPILKKQISDDQKRIMTPMKAISLGADYLVIGRPILNSKNPKKLVELINDNKI